LRVLHNARKNSNDQFYIGKYYNFKTFFVKNDKMYLLKFLILTKISKSRLDGIIYYMVSNVIYIGGDFRNSMNGKIKKQYAKQRSNGDFQKES
jgi:hypothetical protein